MQPPRYEQTGSRKSLPEPVPLLELDLLRTFITVVDYGGFTKAASLLGRTQAAISLKIKRLEETSNCRLLRRTQRALELTAEGETLALHARRILALNDEIYDSINPGVTTGTVRVGATEHYATHILPPLFAEFCAEHPRVRIDLYTMMSPVMMGGLGTTLDLVIGVVRDGASGVTLQRQRGIWVTSATHDTHLKEPLPVVLLPHGSILREWAIAALQRRQKPWRIACVTNSVASLISIINAGLAIGVVAETTFQAGLRRLTSEDGFPKMPTLGVTLSGTEANQSRAVNALKRFLREKLEPQQNVGLIE